MPIIWATFVAHNFKKQPNLVSLNINSCCSYQNTDTILFNETDLELKYEAYTDELRRKLHEIKFQQHDDCSLLHLAARHKRAKFCYFLINQIKIGFFLSIYLKLFKI